MIPSHETNIPAGYEQDDYFDFVRNDLEAMQECIKNMLASITKRYPPTEGRVWGFNLQGKLALLELF